MKKLVVFWLMLSSVAVFAQAPVEYYWTQGASRVYMGPANDNICYLQAMGGRFEGKRESVMVGYDNGHYRLSGRSNQHSVFARARCIQANGELYEHRDVLWWQPQDSVFVADNKTNVCYLRQVSGKFEGPGEAVRVYRDGNGWRINGKSNQINVHALARCTKMQTGYWSKTYSWSQGQPDVVMSPFHNTICVLQRVTGKFEGYAEFVQITTNNGNGRYMLGGNSRQVGVGATAICFKPSEIGT
ncbi:hypothetical protein FKG94_01100 [Exilibacterium tricleocarpae]|uniref:Uncharacterized protein n=1 Tax=Exilibacterium tricleocarpae TaxID=2591008 RepID=A0A545U9P0_9GAMM|nr:hypothetical protein [Exilibacterium tricleocarpae]TQV86181.1 hypothetical protein FKG94_01100 [Exilibacterium tricleocarpae]